MSELGRKIQDTLRTRKARLAAVLLAGGVASAACGSGGESSTAASSSSSAAPSTSPKAEQLCDPHSEEPIIAEDGTELWCEEMQQPSALVFANYKNAGLPFNRPIEEGELFLVRCVQRTPVLPEGATEPMTTMNGDDDPSDVELYEIVLPEHWQGGYTVTNNVWNVRDYDIPFNEQPGFDERVPDCDELPR